MAERIEPAARVYAEALYAAARDAGRTREVDSDLKALISGLGGNRPLVQALANPAIDGPATVQHVNVYESVLAYGQASAKSSRLYRQRDLHAIGRPQCPASAPCSCSGSDTSPRHPNRALP